jgi:nucleotide-binding universal stress UspA family protein
VAPARPILCAIEDSDPSRHAVHAGKWLAEELGTELVLAHVLDLEAIPALPTEEMRRRNISDQDLEGAARIGARRVVDEAVRAAGGGAVAAEVREGPVAGELLELASARRAALLVAGSAARSGLDRVLAGSVSSTLAANASCPVVVVASDAALHEPGPVVAGYDGSEHSLRAARHAAALAARMRRELVLLHVTDEARLRPDQELADELYAAGVRGLGDEPGRPALDLKVRLAVTEGEPARALAAYAREESAALLVVGTRGRNVLSSALLGSVSAGLVPEAGRPVALVAPRAGDTAVAP